jgi:fatty acid desaturase
MIIIANVVAIVLVTWSAHIYWWQWPMLLANVGVIVLTWRYSLPVARRQRDAQRARTSRNEPGMS